jgi:hypothetical protein
MLKSYDEEIIDITSKRIDLANKYAKERKEYGLAKSEIDILLAAKIIKLTETKKNLGYEIGLIMLMAEGGIDVITVYKSMVQHYNNFKAIERMLDAMDSKVMGIQSIMRFNRENEHKGDER